MGVELGGLVLDILYPSCRFDPLPRGHCFFPLTWTGRLFFCLFIEGLLSVGIQFKFCKVILAGSECSTPYMTVNFLILSFFSDKSEKEPSVNLVSSFPLLTLPGYSISLFDTAPPGDQSQRKKFFVWKRPWPVTFEPA